MKVKVIHRCKSESGKCVLQIRLIPKTKKRKWFSNPVEATILQLFSWSNISILTYHRVQSIKSHDVKRVSILDQFRRHLWKPSFKSWESSFPPRECQGLLPSPACQCQQRHSGILWKFAEIVWTTEVVLPVEIGEVVGHALRQTRLKKSNRGRQVVGHLYLVKGTTVD